MLTNELAQSIVDCYSRDGKVLICGNGGLAAESEHFCGELMGKYGRDIFIPCIALTCNSSLITAISNDIGFDKVFAHQVTYLGTSRDFLIAMTTSNSLNVYEAIDAGKKINMRTLLLDRRNIAGDDVATIQENILKLLHQVAREAKEIIYDRSRLNQPQQSGAISLRGH